MQDIRDESLMQLTDFLVKNGEQAFRARQVYEWLWKKNAPDFASMTNISSALRQLLQNNYRLQHIKVAAEQKHFLKRLSLLVPGTLKKLWIKYLVWQKASK